MAKAKAMAPKSRGTKKSARALTSISADSATAMKENAAIDDLGASGIPAPDPVPAIRTIENLAPSATAGPGTRCSKRCAPQISVASASSGPMIEESQPTPSIQQSAMPGPAQTLKNSATATEEGLQTRDFSANTVDTARQERLVIGNSVSGDNENLAAPIAAVAESINSASDFEDAISDGTENLMTLETPTFNVVEETHGTMIDTRKGHSESTTPPTAVIPGSTVSGTSDPSVSAIPACTPSEMSEPSVLAIIVPAPPEPFTSGIHESMAVGTSVPSTPMIVGATSGTSEPSEPSTSAISRLTSSEISELAALATSGATVSALSEPSASATHESTAVGAPVPSTPMISVATDSGTSDPFPTVAVAPVSGASAPGKAMDEATANDVDAHYETDEETMPKVPHASAVAASTDLDPLRLELEQIKKKLVSKCAIEKALNAKEASFVKQYQISRTTTERNRILSKWTRAKENRIQVENQVRELRMEREDCKKKMRKHGSNIGDPYLIDGPIAPKKYIRPANTQQLRQMRHEHLAFQMKHHTVLINKLKRVFDDDVSDNYREGKQEIDEVKRSFEDIFSEESRHASKRLRLISELATDAQEFKDAF